MSKTHNDALTKAMETFLNIEHQYVDMRGVQLMLVEKHEQVVATLQARVAGLVDAAKRIMVAMDADIPGLPGSPLEELRAAIANADPNPSTSINSVGVDIAEPALKSVNSPEQHAELSAMRFASPPPVIRDVGMVGHIVYQFREVDKSEAVDMRITGITHDEARQIAEQLGGGSVVWQHGKCYPDRDIVCSTASPPPAVPDGYVMVPREPTQVMLDAAWKHGDKDKSDAPDPYYAYRAMIEAGEK